MLALVGRSSEFGRAPTCAVTAPELIRTFFASYRAERDLYGIINCTLSQSKSERSNVGTVCWHGGPLSTMLYRKTVDYMGSTLPLFSHP